VHCNRIFWVWLLIQSFSIIRKNDSAPSNLAFIPLIDKKAGVLNPDFG
jgi:hypothetical protein